MSTGSWTLPRRVGGTVAVAIGLLSAIAPPAQALRLLTAGKVARFGSAGALVRVTRDPALAPLHDPRCPAASSVRFAASQRALTFEDRGEVSLPCTGWRATRSGYRYRGTAGGVRAVDYGRRGVVIRAGGPGFAPIAGPVAYVEAWLGIGDELYLVRFHTFRENGAKRLSTHRPSRDAAAGEAAFWDTLWGDRPRDDEALALLERAIRRSPGDGRSQFLLGMLHLYRSGEATPAFDFAHASDTTKAEIRAAREPLDRAVALLPEDTRVPGFRGAATYADGFIHGDAATTALGLGQLDAAVTLNPLFDSFDVFAVVAPVLPGSDGFYQTRILPLVDFVLKDNLACPATLPEICSNAGMAPHNFEGTLLLLGDIYAKGARLADASLWYGLARVFSEGTGYRFQAIAEERVAHAADRVALYQDGDPANDPPLLGGGGAACVYCHNK